MVNKYHMINKFIEESEGQKANDTANRLAAISRASLRNEAVLVLGLLGMVGGSQLPFLETSRA